MILSGEPVSLRRIMRSARIGTMEAVIWHNPKCSTSRKVLEMIRAKGVEPEIVDYQKTPPSAAEINAALKAMGMKRLCRPVERLQEIL
jgi:arsenate reductase (glutaredoxin)